MHNLYVSEYINFLLVQKQLLSKPNYQNDPFRILSQYDIFVTGYDFLVNVKLS